MSGNVLQLSATANKQCTFQPWLLDAVRCSIFNIKKFIMRTEFQRLIDDLEELKSTKLYKNSFKAIDDCIHLLYSRKNYFESLEQKTTDKNLDLINFINERKKLLEEDLSDEDSNIWIHTYTEGQISELNEVLGFIYCT